MNRVERQVVGAVTTAFNAGGLAVVRGKSTAGNVRMVRHVQRAGIEWQGIPVSPGIAQGPAVIHPRKEEYGSVPVGSILVCPCMEPSLIELLPLCRGLVCDRGGRLNPTAATAREYGIPVVTCMGWVTDAIRHGDVVRIDGDNGTVTVLSRSVAAVRLGS